MAVVRDNALLEREQGTSRIWIVEDEVDLLVLLAFVIREAGFAVESFSRAGDALIALDAQMPDLMVLDLRLGDGDGLAVYERLRACEGGEDVPVLIVSGGATLIDRYRALAAGVDDFLAKPVDSIELLLRIRNQLRRRVAPAPAARFLHVGALELDLALRVLHRGDTSESLTPNEFNVLRYLMERPGLPVSVEDLLVEALGYPPRLGSPEILRTHIRNLREKIEEEPSRPRILLNRPRIGYLVAVPEYEP